jgi:uncharacterized DUF497 family protein
MRFEWDREKDRLNQQKHRVSFHEAMDVFDDPLQWTIRDPDHSTGENRYLTTGSSAAGRVLIVAHTEDEDDRIRIITSCCWTPTLRRSSTIPKAWDNSRQCRHKVSHALPVIGEELPERVVDALFVHRVVAPLRS